VFAAIIGLVGVAVGALVTGGVQFALERVRSRDLQKVAARLLLDELAWMAADVVQLIQTPAPITNERIEQHDPLFALWAEYRPLLATKLNRSDWAKVSGAIRQSHVLLQMPPSFGPAPSDYLRHIDQAIDAATQVLGALDC
jgi:hypothetical protein